MKVEVKKVWHSNDRVNAVAIKVDSIWRDKNWLLDNGIIICTRKGQIFDTFKCVDGSVYSEPFNTIFTPEEMSKANGSLPRSAWTALSFI